jgi:hypothetical protein
VNFFFLGDYSPPPPCAVHSHKGPTGPALYSRTEKISYKKRWAAAVNDITFQLLFQRVTPPILFSDSIRVTHYIFIIYKTAQFHSKPKWNPLWSWCAWSPSSPLHLKSITLDDVSFIPPNFYFIFIQFAARIWFNKGLVTFLSVRAGRKEISILKMFAWHDEFFLSELVDMFTGRS